MVDSLLLTHIGGRTMSHIKDFADQLQQDVVSDMAESYFGARKDLEIKIEAYFAMVDELRSKVPLLSQTVANLHFLLLDRATVRDFFISLDILPSCMPDTHMSSVQIDSIPFALTGRGRYIRTVLAVYDQFQLAADEYLNGRYYNDPDQPGRKRLTVHYTRLMALAEHINAEIKKMNEDMSTTAILRHVKGMDPVQTTREEIMGDVCLMEGCAFDQDMCFTPVDFEGLGLPKVQDVPGIDDVKGPVVMFCKGLYAERKKDIALAMSSLRNSD